MRKQEMLHLHGLYREIHQYLQSTESVRIDTAAYEELGTTPTAIHKSKSDHEEAGATLLDAIETAVTTAEDDLDSSSAVAQRD